MRCRHYFSSLLPLSVILYDKISKIFIGSLQPLLAHWRRNNRGWRSNFIFNYIVNCRFGGVLAFMNKFSLNAHFINDDKWRSLIDFH